jgi:hypothetical protein
VDHRSAVDPVNSVEICALCGLALHKLGSAMIPDRLNWILKGTNGY